MYLTKLSNTTYLFLLFACKEFLWRDHR